MKPAKWNTPLIAAAGGLFGASAASYQVAGRWASSPEAVLPHAGYIIIVGVVFGVICGIASMLFNRSAG